MKSLFRAMRFRSPTEAKNVSELAAHLNPNFGGVYNETEIPVIKHKLFLERSPLATDEEVHTLPAPERLAAFEHEQGPLYDETRKKKWWNPIMDERLRGLDGHKDYKKFFEDQFFHASGNKDALNLKDTDRRFIAVDMSSSSDQTVISTVENGIPTGTYDLSANFGKQEVEIHRTSYVPGKCRIYFKLTSHVSIEEVKALWNSGFKKRKEIHGNMCYFLGPVSNIPEKFRGIEIKPYVTREDLFKELHHFKVGDTVRMNKPPMIPDDGGTQWDISRMDHLDGMISIVKEVIGCGEAPDQYRVEGWFFRAEWLEKC